MKLGERLKTIAAMVPKGAVLADIGTDHAYLPIFLVEQGIVSRAIAGDVHKGPYLSAKSTVLEAGLQDGISVRLGDGLEVLTPGEADVIAIAGMGGPNIVDILSSRPEIISEVKRLILQPMIGAAQVRHWLTDNGWRLIQEQLVEDEGRLYQVIAAERGKGELTEPILAEIGPLLWQERNPLLRRHIAELTSHLRGVLRAMSESREAVNSAKYQEFVGRLKDLEEKYKCL